MPCVGAAYFTSLPACAISLLRIWRALLHPDAVDRQKLHDLQMSICLKRSIAGCRCSHNYGSYIFFHSVRVMAGCIRTPWTVPAVLLQGRRCGSEARRAAAPDDYRGRLPQAAAAAPGQGAALRLGHRGRGPGCLAARRHPPERVWTLSLRHVHFHGVHWSSPWSRAWAAAYACMHETYCVSVTPQPRTVRRATLGPRRRPVACAPGPPARRRASSAQARRRAARTSPCTAGTGGSCLCQAAPVAGRRPHAPSHPPRMLRYPATSQPGSPSRSARWKQ